MKSIQISGLDSSILVLLAGAEREPRFPSSQRDEVLEMLSKEARPIAAVLTGDETFFSGTSEGERQLAVTAAEVFRRPYRKS